MSYDVKFQYIIRDADGVPYPAIIGLGSDGTLWVDPGELGVEPEDMKRVSNYPGTAPLVLIDIRTRRVFVNARAVAETIAAADVRARMCEGIEVIVKEMQRARPKHENVRNN